jgi:hypothetical protein
MSVGSEYRRVRGTEERHKTTTKTTTIDDNQHRSTSRVTCRVNSELSEDSQTYEPKDTTICAQLLSYIIENRFECCEV